MSGQHALHRTFDDLDSGIRSGIHLGGQIYVSRAGKIIADHAFGDARETQPMTPEHLMWWLSSGKPVTAVAFAQLWEQGLFGLDDLVADHVPGFGQGGKQSITLRHLLTHTAGIRMLGVGWPEVEWDESIRRISARKLEPGWQPGQKAGYHTESSWFILGEVVRRASGTPFSSYVREKIFEPLGMSDSWIGMPENQPSAYGEQIAPMYDAGEGSLSRSPWATAERLVRPSPGANACGPIRELGRFYEMLLAGGSLDGARILSAQTVEALTTRHRVGLLDRTFKRHIDWGLGFILDSKHYREEAVPYGYGPHASSRTFGHSGNRSSTGFVDPEHQLVVAIAVNGMPSSATHFERFDTVTAAIYEDLGLAEGAAEL